MQDNRNIENVIQEIMGLVSHAMDRAMWAGELILDEDRLHFESRFEEANYARSLIKSKLRELVENKFSVQNPLTDEQIEKLRRETFSTDNPFCPCDSKTMRKAVWAAERAHNITEGI